MMKKFLSLLLAALLMSTTFFGCSKHKSDSLLFPITGDIDSLDPQIADSPEEKTIIENTIEGLVRILDGKVVKGAADDWTVSGDGLTYTFTLHKGLKWDLNAKITAMMGDGFDPDITAHDFVFALRRACMPATDAPDFSAISAIENAMDIHSGKMSETALGVRAQDDYTLVITLSKPDDDFLATLATAIAMPCNEEFFNATKGRYGLEKDYTLFNGPFYLSKWLGDSLLIRASEVYAKCGGKNLPLPSKVTFRVTTDSDSVMKNLIDGIYDAALITGKDSKSISEKDKIALTQYNNKTANLLFNCNDAVFSNENMRRAFSLSFSSVESASGYLSASRGMIPETYIVGGKPYRDTAGNVVIGNDTAEAEKAWKRALSELDLDTLDITLLCPPEYEPYLKESIQGVQKTVGQKVSYINADGKTIGVNVSIKLKTLEAGELNSRLKTGEYQIVLLESNPSDDAYALIDDLVSYNRGGAFKTDDAAAVLERWQYTDNADEMIRLAKKSEETIINKFMVYPFLNITNYFALAKGASGIYFNTTEGTVSFIHGKLKG